MDRNSAACPIEGRGGECMKLLVLPVNQANYLRNFKVVSEISYSIPCVAHFPTFKNHLKICLFQNAFKFLVGSLYF